jgi:RecA-family ATPase
VERPKSDGRGEPDFDRRIITVKKANYAPIGLSVPLRWTEGVLVREDPNSTAARNVAVEQHKNEADEVFLNVLGKLNSQGGTFSSAPGSNYAPKVFAEHPDARDFRQKALTAAMERLLKAKRIHVVWEGPSSRRRQRLVPGNPD